MAGHAILSPSSAYRWLACTPSARFEEQIPEEESEYAAEGTLAHELAALVLSGRSGLFKGKNHAQFNTHLSFIMGRVVKFYTDKKEMSEEDAKAEFYVMLEHAEAWTALILEYGGEIFIEKSYDLSTYIPLGFGTADGTNYTPRVLYVSDFKYGAGVPVSATANKQMMLYGLGALIKAHELGHKPDTVVLTIFQPRAGGTSTWEISVKDLLTWAEKEAKPKAQLAIAGQGEFVPGAHCQFCKARTSCAAYYKCFSDVRKLQDKRVMTDKERATVLTYGPMLSSWVKKVEAEAIKNIQAGKKLAGFKVVAGKGRRQFRNEDNVVDILLGYNFDSEQIFNASLRSLTDLERALGPKHFNEVFADELIRIEGNPQLATEDDNRPAIGASAADEYDDDLI